MISVDVFKTMVRALPMLSARIGGVRIGFLSKTDIYILYIFLKACSESMRPNTHTAQEAVSDFRK